MTLERRTPLVARTGLQRGTPLVRSQRSQRPLRGGAPQLRGEGLHPVGQFRQRQSQPRRVVTQTARKVRAAGGKFSRRVRAAMWARCEGLCECCGGPLPEKGWTAQHRKARGMGGTRRTMTAADGIAVHQVPCHEYLEGEPDEAREMGWRVDQADDPETAPLILPGGRRVLLTVDGTYVDMPVLP